jgi:Ca2+-transporting ATPase
MRDENPADAVTAGEAVAGDATPWHELDTGNAAARLEVDPVTGLTGAEATRRLALHGPNQLAEKPPRPRWKRFLDQFRSTLVYVLVGAAVVAAAVGDVKDPIVIGLVLLLNAVLGYVQEGRAENALAALERMLVTRVRVRRDGIVDEIDATTLTPGDVVLLEAGDRVPADGRLLVAASVAVDESALTGESVPVDKTSDVLASSAARMVIGDRHNEAFMNTTVVRGRAELLVTATGMSTEMGRVASMLGEAEPGPTPLQVQLEHLGKRLAGVAVLAVALVFALQLAQGEPLADAVIGAVALAVAAIPEGLPAVVTVTLAVGVRQMALRNAIVKRLASVETLGATTVICSDKTGTLTLNEMTATDLVTADRRWEVSGQGYGFDGEVRDPHAPDTPAPSDAVLVAALCNDASVRDGELVGDPTEGALVVLAAKAGIDVDQARRRFERVGEVPFDSTTKLMATFHAEPDDPATVLVAVKGAPDVLLDRCDRAAVAVGTTGLDAARRDQLTAANRELAARGLRVLALASRRIATDDAVSPDGVIKQPERWMTGLTLDGLVGIVDPPRSEAADAIGLCHRAGIAVKMITGDHADTARAIAGSLGLDGDVVTGAQLDAMDDGDLAERVEEIGVFARVSPEHKVRVVRALQAHGHVVAMTGDGVNDAAALRTAEIGVAMGITGTEVTKEAGDMVLADDNFATIVGAVERGRTIYDNIVKFVRFQLSTNLGAIGTVLTASAIGLPVPFTAIQVLYVNLIADGPPAMTLGVDPPSPGIMDRSPRRTDAAILDLRRASRLLIFAAVMVMGTVGVLVWGRDTYGEEVGLTMAFTTFVLFQLVNVFNARTEHSSALSGYSFTNRRLWGAITGVALLQVAVVHVGFLQDVFTTTSLTAGQWLVCAAVALTVLFVEELRKLGASARRRR